MHACVNIDVQACTHGYAHLQVDNTEAVKEELRAAQQRVRDGEMRSNALKLFHQEQQLEVRALKEQMAMQQR